MMDFGSKLSRRWLPFIRNLLSWNLWQDGFNEKQSLCQPELLDFLQVLPTQQLETCKHDSYFEFNFTDSSSIFSNSSYSLSFFSLSLSFSFLLDFGLKILIETKLKVTNFLDLTLNLKTGTYHPYRKPNDSPSYINIFCYFWGKSFLFEKVFVATWFFLLNTDPSGETNSIQISLTSAAQCKAGFEPCDEQRLAEQIQSTDQIRLCTEQRV